MIKSLLAVSAFAFIAFGTCALVGYLTGHGAGNTLSKPATAVIKRLKTEEAFRGNPYQDTLDNETIGYGTKLPITQAEGAYLLRERLTATSDALLRAWAPFKTLPGHVQEALLDMAYQVGVEGLLGFHDMLTALERGDYQAAKAAALSSHWAIETPHRAQRVADLLK